VSFLIDCGEGIGGEGCSRVCADVDVGGVCRGDVVVFVGLEGASSCRESSVSESESVSEFVGCLFGLVGRVGGVSGRAGRRGKLSSSKMASQEITSRQDSRSQKCQAFELSSYPMKIIGHACGSSFVQRSMGVATYAKQPNAQKYETSGM
jgi:hypothetical protein